MAVRVQASVVVTGVDDAACDRVLQALAAMRDEAEPLYVSVSEKSRELADE